MSRDEKDRLAAVGKNQKWEQVKKWGIDSNMLFAVKNEFDMLHEMRPNMKKPSMQLVDRSRVDHRLTKKQPITASRCLYDIKLHRQQSNKCGKLLSKCKGRLAPRGFLQNIETNSVSGIGRRR